MKHELRPQTCVWEITLACDLACGHCGSGAGRPRPDELSTAEALRLVESLARLDTRVVTLSGGEPTLRSDWDTLAGALTERGIVTTLITNGWGMTGQLAQRMGRSGLASVAVSLDGPPAIHERIRGAGTWRRATAALERLAEAGMRTGVITTVNKLNLPYLEEVHERAALLGAEAIRFQLGKPMGNMADRPEWVLEPEDLLGLLPRLGRLALGGGPPVRIGDSLGYFGPDDTALRAIAWDGTPQIWGGCQAGLSTLGIQSDGGVKGCLSLQAFAGAARDPFLEGSIRQRPLEAIWGDPDAFAYNRRPVRPDGFCRSCRHVRLCRGGARCVTTTLSTSWWEDPYCYHRLVEQARSRPLTRLARQVGALASAAALAGVGCFASAAPEPDPGDTDGDIDGDTDADSDADGDADTDSGTDTTSGPCDEVSPMVLDECCLPGPVNCAAVDCDADPIPVPEEVYQGCCVGEADYAYIPPPCTTVDYETLVFCCPEPSTDD